MKKIIALLILLILTSYGFYKFGRERGYVAGIDEAVDTFGEGMHTAIVCQDESGDFSGRHIEIVKGMPPSTHSLVTYCENMASEDKRHWIGPAPQKEGKQEVKSGNPMQPRSVR